MLFFELIQVSLGHRERLSMTPSASEWQYLYQLSQQHTLVGICYVGVQRLPVEQRPPAPLLADWQSQAQQVRERNALVSRRSVEACAQLEQEGFNTCLLKGQGIGLLYGALAEYRQSGDIDLWVTPKDQPCHRPKERIIRFVRAHASQLRLHYHHVDYPLFDDAAVDLHFFPIYLNNMRLNRHLSVWYRGQHDMQMRHTVELAGQLIHVPTKEFNSLYLLLHIYKHFFQDGIGLRQLMDYYFVLVGELGMSKAEYWARHWELSKLLRMLKLETLAGAVMYVMKEVFAMPDNYLICPPNRGAGISLLSDILQSGNFGLYDTRYDKSDESRKGWTSKLHSYWRKTKRSLVNAYHFPHEGLFEPIAHAYHFLWLKLSLWKLG